MPDGPPRILVIDDDDDMVFLVRRMLERAGMNVLSTNEGQGGIDLAARERPDVILLDVGIPDMDGYAVCTRLQEMTDTRMIPVVFVTGFQQEQNRARAFSVGAADYLVKPFSRDQLISTVRKQLENRKNFYSVRQVSELWDVKPLGDKFQEFVEAFVRRHRLTEVQQLRARALSPTEVYELSRTADIPEADLSREMAEFLGMSFVEMIDTGAIELGILPLHFCRENSLVALRETDEALSIAITNPFIWDLQRIDALNRVLRGRPYRLVEAPPAAITSLFIDQSKKQLEMVAPNSSEDENRPVKTLEELLGSPDTVSAVDAADAIIAEAVRRGASDIHIEPGRSYVRVRFRIDGRLVPILPLQRSLLSALIARIKVISGMDISENRRPQDGGFKARVDTREVELRVSTLPGTHGEIAVLRILNSNVNLQRLDKLGLESQTLQAMHGLLVVKQGMILVTGPTGSGKSTTLYAMLNHLNREDVNITTVEDPVEIDVPGVNQVQVNVQAGRTFAGTLRSMLRQDPDIIMLGEIRDLETAEIACRAALTGHLVMSTLHTLDTIGTVTRLLDMNVPSYLVTSALHAIIAQRLIRRICDNCSEPYIPPAGLIHAMRARFGSRAETEYRRGRGCPRCNGTGSRGRVGVYEILKVDDTLRRLISGNATPMQLHEHATATGLRSLEDDAFEKTRLGMTSPEEILNLGFSLAMTVAADDSVPVAPAADATAGS